jgi:hypothetical protein
MSRVMNIFISVVARASRRAASRVLSTFGICSRPNPEGDIDTSVDAARLEARATYTSECRALRMSVAWLAFLVAGLAGTADQNALRIGDLFPQFSGQTPTGKSLALPAASGGPQIIMFSFSRMAGKDARVWNEHLSEFANSVSGYQAIVLESVPRLFRGTALSGIKSSMPAALQDRTIVLYQDEKLWKARLSVSDGDLVYVFLLGADRRIRWSNTKAFTVSEFARLKDEIERLLHL